MAYKKSKIKQNRRWIWVVITLGFWFLIHCMYTTYDGLHNYEGNADVAVVLGNTVYADSSLSPWLRCRVDKSLELYEKKRVKKIVVSGGKGEFGVKEGSAMQKYLLAKHVAPQDILVDNNGDNTHLTAINLVKIRDTLGFSSVIAVSSFYHITRSKFIFRKLGLSHVYGVASDCIYRQDAYGLFREFFAFYKYAIFY